MFISPYRTRLPLGPRPKGLCRCPVLITLTTLNLKDDEITDSGVAPRFRLRNVPFDHSTHFVAVSKAFVDSFFISLYAV